MVLKYKREFDRLGCSLAGCREWDAREAFCWAFEDINDVRNFVPRAVSQEGRAEECGDWGLSFFRTKDEAKTRLEKLMRGREHIRKALGTNIAYGSLGKQDGISGGCDKNGHFNHYEYVGCDLKVTFKINGPSI